jgi:type IV pilus assembly protein PilQ
MISFRIVIAFFLFTIAVTQTAYAQNPFQERLGAIQSQLELLSDSIAPGLNELANLSVSNMSLQSFLRTLADGHELNIQIDPSINIQVSNNFSNVQVKDLLYFLCQEHKLDIRFINSILSIHLFEEPAKVEQAVVAKKLKIVFDPATNLLTYDLANDSLRSFVKQVTLLTKRNVITSGSIDIDNRLVRGYIQDLPLENALEKLAYINGLKFSKTKDGVMVFEPNNPPSGQFQGNSPSIRNAQGEITVRDSLVDLDVVNYPIADIIHQVSPQLKKDYFIFSEITGVTTARVKGIRYDELLSLLFQSTNYTFKKSGNVVLIALRNIEGFRSTEIYKLDYRPVDGIDKELPAELIKEIEIRPVKELNALILNGLQHRVSELITFLRLIDQPVPNILIEVIVADAKKSFNLQTGLKAFLSDSVPKTSGQVFPGVDVTLGTNSVNSFLGRLGSKGIINLGKVTPNFYVTLQALERNNNIQLRSTPKLSTINGSKANLTIGESVYYVEQTQNITGGVNPITTTAQRFNKVEANLSITISPVVSGNEHITLDIVAEFSDFIPPTIENAPPGNATRKFESKIRIRNEEMIILGGLEELTKSDTGSGTPVLSRIPILKWLFSSRSKESSDNQLVVFIKPTIVY